MNPHYLFSDESEEYLLPVNRAAGEYCMRLRMEDIPAQVFLILRGARTARIPMAPAETKGRLRYYGATVSGIFAAQEYCFEILAERTWYLGRFSCAEEESAVTPFAVLPALAVPDWAKGQIFYQIFPDRFRNGCADNDVRTGEYEYPDFGPAQHVEDWNSAPAPRDVVRFYGGDLQGILEKLPYIKALGADCLYLNPVFVSPSNHKYDTQDYHHIDPHLSDPADPDGYFAAFAETLHENGLRLILDGVFNHCSIENAWVKDPATADFFYYDAQGRRETWWGIPTLPKLNYDGCPRLWDEVLAVAKKWVTAPYFADGWRLDVAPELAACPDTNHRFWKAFRDAVREAAPDALVFAETYEDAAAWLTDGEWDTIMNYEAFMDPVTFFFTGVDKHSDYAAPEKKGDAALFYKELREKSARLPFASLLAAMNALDNHDHSRFITRTSGLTGRLTDADAAEKEACADPALLRLAVCFQFTWPGAPCIYYGDETALPGFTDPDNRRPYPWGHENWEMIEFYRQAALLRKRHACLRTGSVYPLYFADGVAAFARTLEEETVLTVINLGPETTLALDVAGLGLENGTAEREFGVRDGSYCIGSDAIPVEDACLCLVAKEKSAAVFVLRKA